MSSELLDPAALFLLDLRYENLYNPTPAESVFTCKCCRETLYRWEREDHHRLHRAQVELARIRAKQEQARIAREARIKKASASS